MATWRVPLRIEGPGVDDFLSKGGTSPNMRLGDVDLGMATWELEVEAEDEEQARSAALDALRDELGDEAYRGVWDDRTTWNAIPTMLQAPPIDRPEEAMGGG